MLGVNSDSTAPHKSIKLIARCKLTFDERVILHFWYMTLGRCPLRILCRAPRIIIGPWHRATEGPKGMGVSYKKGSTVQHEAEGLNRAPQRARAASQRQNAFQAKRRVVTCVRTGAWTGPPRGERAPRVGISPTVFGVRAPWRGSSRGPRAK